MGLVEPFSVELVEPCFNLSFDMLHAMISFGIDRSNICTRKWNYFSCSRHRFGVAFGRYSGSLPEDLPNTMQYRNGCGKESYIYPSKIRLMMMMTQLQCIMQCIMQLHRRLIIHSKQHIK